MKRNVSPTLSVNFFFQLILDLLKEKSMIYGCIGYAAFWARLIKPVFSKRNPENTIELSTMSRLENS